jgi:hypothetical protein
MSLLYCEQLQRSWLICLVSWRLPCRLFTWWHIYNIIRNVPTLCYVFGHMDVIDCFWYFVASEPNLATSIPDHFRNVMVKCGWRGYVCLSASEITLLSLIYCFRCGDDFSLCFADFYGPWWRMQK